MLHQADPSRLLCGRRIDTFLRQYYQRPKFQGNYITTNGLNFKIIILLPKIADAARIQQYRPICLLNVSFKIFTKVLNNRLLKVADKLIGPSQTVFILGRYIMEGVVILHETIHELHRKKQDGVILKLDFEKNI